MYILDLFEQRELPLFEKRRNAKVNQKVSALNALAKYKGRQDVFVTFTSDVGVGSHRAHDDPENTPSKDPRSGVRALGPAHNVRGSKFGINPSSSFNTPLGIYAYPIDYVLEVGGNVPFAKNMPYLYVFQSTGHLLHLNDYTESDLKRDVSRILDEAYGIEGFDVRKAEAAARYPTPGGQIWNITRVASQYTAATIMKDEGKKPPKIDYEGDEPIKPKFEESVKLHETRAQPQVVQWSKLLQRLGYDGAIDEGEGIIHENEMTQAVFFSTAKLKVLEKVHNISPRAKMNQFDIWNEKPPIFYNMLRQGKIDAETLIAYMQENPQVFTFMAGRIDWSMFPPEAQAWIKENIVSLVAEVSKRRSSPNAFMRWVPLNDNDVIRIITKIPGELPFISSKYFTEPVLKYLSDNVDMFRRYLVQMFNLPDALQIKALEGGKGYIDLFFNTLRPDYLPSIGVVKWLLDNDFLPTLHYMETEKILPNLTPDLIRLLFQYHQKVPDDQQSKPEWFLRKLMTHEAVTEMQICLETMNDAQVKAMVQRIVADRGYFGWTTRAQHFLKFVQRYRPQALEGVDINAVE